MHLLRRFGHQTFASLKIRNYRLYFIGQGISLSGSWMQTISQDLLVLRLTGSGAALGLVVALQTLPVLLFGPWGGVIADRYPKRNIIYVTQSLFGILALLLGTLVLTGLVKIWMIYLMAVALGLVNSVDNPTRQTFVLDMVGRDHLANAVSLNSSEFNLARVIGPTFAGALITAVDLGWSFILNGLSYIPVIIMLYMMHAEELQPTPLLPRAKGRLQEGFRYVKSSSLLLTPLIMMVLIGALTYEFSVTLPLLARFTLKGSAGTYAALTAAMGVGAVIGGIYTAGRRRAGLRTLGISAALFGTSVLLTAIAPNLPLALLALVLVGFFSINFTSLANVTLQLESAPDMRGRVMALWTMASIGSTPFGGPIIGWIGQLAGARLALAVGGFAALTAAAFCIWQMKRQTRADLQIEPDPDLEAQIEAKEDARVAK
ncbi:MAG TPA: MFS transporter [Thermomicrobiales bacterium]|nr:MFS transporter [Thermomicrobiales bacterium]